MSANDLAVVLCRFLEWQTSLFRMVHDSSYENMDIALHYGAMLRECIHLQSIARQEIVEDPVEDDVSDATLEGAQDDIENIIVVEPTEEWTQFRLNISVDMFNTWH
ncbi:uncharacterized protein LOC120254445 [Dioscorea cayenensis subsp. rotundata]|uniref:Uncharacterized protein LOC120254445 n=1 Tax=Dioscorea cayennensis subsp. rotundata TaxID=55577 RepID=A0AB40AUE5_DIOCR|nr:uncharacterized protein LOC120254445 [Dioscorea cayenensis subsp. rotundata]